jgi:hypothetical protein
LGREALSLSGESGTEPGNTGRRWRSARRSFFQFCFTFFLLLFDLDFQGFRESVLPFFSLIYFVSLFSFLIWILHGMRESGPCRFLICGHGGGHCQIYAVTELG